MLAAFAEAGRVLDRPDYTAAATKNAEFILSAMQKDGRLFRIWKAGSGESRLMGYLEDYSFFADGLLALYQSTFESQWFQEAQTLMDVVLEHFQDDQGGFFDTADDHEQLVMRPKDLQDNAIPSGNSMAVRTLLMLAAYTGQAKYETAALQIMASLQGVMSQHAGAFAHWLGALEFALAPPKEIALIGPAARDDTLALLRTLQKPYRPNQVVAFVAEDTAGSPALVEGRSMIEGKATVYVCQNFTCQQPVTDEDALEASLK
jgi:uncharacterized protein YyaL (SSP411 family)